jgi:hypothetical protein
MKRTLAILPFLALAACSSKTPEPKGGGSSVEAAPAAPASKGAPGPKVAGEGYTVEVAAPADAAANAEHASRVLLKPTQGYHVNKDYPTSLKVTAPEGVSCANAEQTGSAAVKLEEQEALFDVKCTAAAAGEKKFEAKFSFAICLGEKACYPKTETLAWNVAVK